MHNTVVEPAILGASRKLGKRKRGGRSAAAIAARIERGYLKRSGTAGWHRVRTEQPCRLQQEQQLMAAGHHPAVERAAYSSKTRAVTILTSEGESLARQVQNLTATSTSTQGQRFGVRARVVDTREIGKP